MVKQEKKEWEKGEKKWHIITDIKWTKLAFLCCLFAVIFRRRYFGVDAQFLKMSE